MDKEIIKSVIEITRNRDLDSLECSLVATLAELLPATAISIYKLHGEHVSEGFDEVVSLTITEAEKGDKNFIWDIKSGCMILEKHVEQCLLDVQSISYQLDKTTTRLLIPLHNEKDLFGVIRIDSLKTIDAHQSSIEGLIKIYENYQSILHESERDKLTRLLNRRTFETKLGRLLKSQQQEQEQYSSPEKLLERRKKKATSHAWMAMADIDHFKRINDNYGHLFGDEVLLRLAQLMRKCFRSSDLLFRFGGEEFVIILEPIPYESAILVFERFRKTLETYEFPQLGCITISIGFEKISINDFPDTVLENIDKALYYAKERGRNCVHNYQQLIEDGNLHEVEAKSDVDLF